MKALRPREVIKLLEKAGFSKKRQTGSHVIMAKPNKRSIPIPTHSKTLKQSLQMAIFKQAGLSSEDVHRVLAKHTP